MLLTAQTFDANSSRIQNASNHDRGFRFDINGGVGYVLGDVPSTGNDALDDYTRRAKFGQQGDAGLHFFFNQRLGIGVTTAHFFSYNEARVVDYDVNGNVIQGYLKDEIRVSFYAPSVSIRILDKGRHKVYWSGAFGPAFYRNDAAFFFRTQIRATTFASSMSFSYDLLVADGFAVGATSSFIIGGFSRFSVDDGVNVLDVSLPDGTFESLIRANFGVGIRLLQ